MPNPTPLVEHARNVRDAWEQSRSAAQQALADAQAALEAARAEATQNTRDLAEAEQAITARNAALPLAETPADQDALVTEIAELRATSRELQAAILDATEEAELARAEADVATAAIRRASAGLKAALGALADAERNDQRLESWKAALGAPPLQTLAADAGAALGAAPFTAARNRIQSEIPEKLREAARAGYDTEVARLESFRAAVVVPEDLLSAEQENEGGAMGLVLRRQIAVSRVIDALRRWAERGRERYDRALALLRDVANTDPLLNEDQKDRLQALETDGEAAAEAREEREEKRQAVHGARAALEDARLTALALDPTADVSGVQEVQDAQDALDTAVSELETAQAAYDAARDDYVAWAAAIPDSVWRKVLGFFEAEAILQELSGVNAGNLVSAVETAEQQLADALGEAQQSGVTLAFLADQLALRRERLADARAARQMRLLSATRGDA